MEAATRPAQLVHACGHGVLQNGATPPFSWSPSLTGPSCQAPAAFLWPAGPRWIRRNLALPRVRLCNVPPPQVSVGAQGCQRGAIPPAPDPEALQDPESGRGAGSPRPLPYHRTCGPASGGSSSRGIDTLPCLPPAHLRAVRSDIPRIPRLCRLAAVVFHSFQRPSGSVSSTLTYLDPDIGEFIIVTTSQACLVSPRSPW
jgi:hypothetical protein